MGIFGRVVYEYMKIVSPLKVSHTDKVYLFSQLSPTAFILRHKGTLYVFNIRKENFKSYQIN